MGLVKRNFPYIRFVKTDVSGQAVTTVQTTNNLPFQYQQYILKVIF